MSDLDDRTTHRQTTANGELDLQWHLVFETTDQVGFFLDSKFRLLAVNPAGCRRLGQEAAALLGRRCYEVMHQTGAPPANCPVLELLEKNGRATLSREMEALGGSFLVSCAPVYDQHGRIRQIIHLATEVTGPQQREARLKNLLRAAPIGIGVVVQRQIREVNDYLCKMLGYCRAELLGQPARILYPSEEEYEYVGQEKYQQMQLFDQGSVETRWQRRDGTIIDILLSSSPVVAGDLQGEVIFTAQEITAYKRVVAALRENENFLQSVFCSIQDGLCILDRDLRIVHVNPTHENMFAAHAPLAGKHCYQAFHGRSQPCEECPSLTTLATGQPAQKIWRYHPADGGPPLWLAIYTHPWREVHSGEIKGVIEYVRDITAQRQAEEAFINLVNAAHIGIYIIQDGYFKVINQPSFEGITGYRQEDLLGQKAIFLVAPEYREQVRQQAKSRLQSNDRRPYEYEIITKRGERRWILETVTSSYYAGRRATLGYWMDITERKRLEQQVQQAAKLEAIGLLAGGIAHDFNNLLAAISGYSELTLLKAGQEHPLTQYAEEIKNLTKRGAALTSQLLAYGRRQVMQPEILNLNHILKAMQPMFSRLLGEDIAILSYLAPDLQTVQIDPAQIEQVIMNLVANARDAMPSGGSLIIETANVYLDEAYAATHIEVTPGPYVMLSISDSGVGMDAAIKDRIFEPFFTTKELGRGTGLGLASVYGIVKQNHGHIRVYSEPGQGSTFKIYLPICAQGDTSKATAPQAAPVLTGYETILVVEDNQDVRQTIGQLLGRFGYQVLTASCPAEAIELSRRHVESIHLLLTDVVLPQMNGRQLAEELISGHPEMKVLFMSGYTANAIVHQGLLDQKVDFLTKPFRLEDLLAKIREVLAR